MTKMPLRRLSQLFINPKFQYGFIVLFSLILLAGLYFGYNYTTIQNVDLRVRDTTKITGITSLKDQNILLVSEKQIAENLKKQNPYINTISVKKDFPDTISISITLLTPTAYLVTTEGYFILGENGRVLSKERGKTQETPIITYYQQFPFKDFQAGSYIVNKDIVDSLYFLDTLISLGINIKTIDIAGYHMLGLYTDSEESYIFSVDKDRKLQSYQIEKMYRQFKIEGKKFKSIDLRFDKPIVTL